MPELKELFSSYWPELPLEDLERFIAFRELVMKENQKQNLTRLVNSDDFFWGHLWDTHQLLGISDLEIEGRTCLDLGSGAGIPGIPTAIVEKKSKWILSESEKSKAEFLKRAVEALSLKNVSIFSGRGEEFLKNEQVDHVFVRAVGSLTKIARVLSKCSTWNNLILFKGPRWDQEKEEYSQEFERKQNSDLPRLEESWRHEYTVPDTHEAGGKTNENPPKRRLIVQMIRK